MEREKKRKGERETHTQRNREERAERREERYAGESNPGHYCIARQVMYTELHQVHLLFQKLLGN
jgi:hypothetical protein